MLCGICLVGRKRWCIICFGLDLTIDCSSHTLSSFFLHCESIRVKCWPVGDIGSDDWEGPDLYSFNTILYLRLDTRPDKHRYRTGANTRSEYQNTWFVRCKKAVLFTTVRLDTWLSSFRSSWIIAPNSPTLSYNFIHSPTKYSQTIQYDHT